MQHKNIPQGSELKSIWKSFSADTGFSALSGDITTDVAIIGGGITGITAAQFLKEAGLNVVVVEALKIGGGSTGGSTGNLYATIEEGFDVIKSKYNIDIAKTVAASRGEAVNLIERNIIRYAIDCDFKRQPWYLYSSNEENRKKVDKELKAIAESGLDVREAGQEEIPFPVAAGIRVGHQAQFNPLRYVQGLAQAIEDKSCHIFEGSAVREIKEDTKNETYTLTTYRGTVTARILIHATHTPKGVFLDFHSLLDTQREYGVAVKLASGNYPEGIFWGYYNTNDRYSVRSYEHNGEKFLMAIGQPHKVGQQENNTGNIANLEKFLREHFDVAGVTNCWGGQNYKPADSLPYIGRKSKGSNEFIATGFSTDGLTWGTVAAAVIRDIILDKETAYTKLFDATRHSPLKAAAKVIKEGINVAGELIRDYIFHKDINLQDIPAGEGKVVEVDGRKLAVYNDAGTGMKACSAVCTHMGCIVHFNKAEQTWDCPCHASRFDTDGSIIEGPALTPLPQVNIKEN